VTEAFCVAAVGRQLAARRGTTTDVVAPRDPFRAALEVGADFEDLLSKRHRDLALRPETGPSRKERKNIALSEPYRTLLSDELEIFCRPERASSRVSKARSEMEIYDRFSQVTVGDIVSSDETFLRFIQEVNSAFIGKPSRFRSNDVYTRPDERGCRSKFAPAVDVAPYLSTIRAGIQEFHNEYPAITAAVSMIALTAIHPFSDANGRTSRLIYNLFCNSDDLAGPFFDLKAARSATEVSYSIKMRRAVSGEWKPLLYQISTYYDIELQSRARVVMSNVSCERIFNARTY